MTFPDAHFDLIVSNKYARPTESFKAILRECHRVLAPGGVLLFQELPISWSALRPPYSTRRCRQPDCKQRAAFVDCAQRDTLAALVRRGSM